MNPAPIALSWILAAMCLCAASAALAEPAGVTVVNESEPTLCAEVDNVYVTLGGKAVDRLTVAARHPGYIGTIVADNTAADYRNCDRSGEEKESFAFDTRRVTIYEDRAIWLVGYVWERYWRKESVPVRVGERVERGLHMIQLWMQAERGPEEFLVLYPPDGYWRLRPLTPDHLHFTSYGSSMLLGPVEIDGRPLVRISEVEFDPEKRAFTLRFKQGGTATVTVKEADKTESLLDVAFEGVEKEGVFAGLRSMYVMPGNADVAEVGWRTKGSPHWTVEPIGRFRKTDDVLQLWLGRTAPSAHNTSAPDILFGGFERAE